jgi:hypothetical protein
MAAGASSDQDASRLRLLVAAHSCVQAEGWELRVDAGIYALSGARVHLRCDRWRRGGPLPSDCFAAAEAAHGFLVAEVRQASASGACPRAAATGDCT